MNTTSCIDISAPCLDLVPTSSLFSVSNESKTKQTTLYPLLWVCMCQKMCAFILYQRHLYGCLEIISTCKVVKIRVVSPKFQCCLEVRIWITTNSQMSKQLSLHVAYLKELTTTGSIVAQSLFYLYSKLIECVCNILIITKVCAY